MAISIKRGVTLSPPRILIYGPKGVGKTTFGAEAPAPILLPLEDGAGVLGVERFEIDGRNTLQSYAEVIEALNFLGQQDHAYLTCIVDSLDWLEPLIHKETCTRNSWADIEAPGYGKGYKAADEVWREFFSYLQALRDHRNMQVILIAHEEVKTFQDPATDPYDRYQIKIHKGAAGVAQEWADMIGFINRKTFTHTKKGAFGREQVKAVDTGDHVLYTEERPSHHAKNRYGLPAEIVLPKDGSYNAFANAMNTAIAARTQPAVAAA
jgi:hypothetical protein